MARTLDQRSCSKGHCCEAWNRLVDPPSRIMSIGLCDWAHRSKQRDLLLNV